MLVNPEDSECAVYDSSKSNDDRACNVDAPNSQWVPIPRMFLVIHVKEPHLSLLATIYPHRVLRVTENDGWVELYITVDSGATKIVIGPKQVPWDYQPSFGSANDIMYEVANGTNITNLGQQRMTIRTSDGEYKGHNCTSL